MFGGSRIVDPGPAMGSEDFSELARLPDGQAVPHHYCKWGESRRIRHLSERNGCGVRR
ncbi:hypothetical protein [Streptomyces anulatus]|uniref:hypothetical protein n=1 Tax=Streptomyces anulatus TaxID=1892 RepID=UPI0036968765